jgi:lysyl endopeptidase
MSELLTAIEKINSTSWKKVRLVSFICIISSISQTNIFSQRSFGGTPESFNLGLKSVPGDVIMAGFSLDSLNKIDSLELTKGHKKYRFAKAFDVNYNPLNSGEWIRTDAGKFIWRICIFSKGAYSIGILLKDYKPLPGSRIFVYNPEHTEILGAFTSENIAPGGFLTIFPISSDRAFIEYDLDSDSISGSGFTIAMIAHDYKNAFGKNASILSNGTSSGSCNVDINCSAGANWQTEKRAVCKLRINLTELCTGVLINNVRKDGKAYMLTASHCIPDVNTAFNTLAIFNYERDSCGGIISNPNQSISGMWLKATTSTIDYSLVELGEKPPVSFYPYYAGWSLDSLGITEGTTIHHPQGDIKKISYSSTAPVTDNFGSGYEYMSDWRITKWNIGTTEPGSSGCPLFDQNHYLIGTLTGGIATCQFPDSDFFQKISKSWTDCPDTTQQLKFWLDPDNTGTRKLRGMNPYAFNVSNCEAISNVLKDELVINPHMTSTSGSYAGHNGLGISLFAERFISSVNLNLTGIILNIAALSPAALNSSLNIKIWKGHNEPDTLIYTQNVLYKSLTLNVKNIITLDKILTLRDTFYVGFEISYGSTDNFALFIAPDRFASDLNTAYAFYNNVWNIFPGISEYQNMSTSMDLGLQSCNIVTDVENTSKETKDIIVYPNPTNGILTIKMYNNQDVPSIQLYDIEGRKVGFTIKNITAGFIEIDMHESLPGIYIIRGQSRQRMWTQKILRF